MRSVLMLLVLILPLCACGYPAGRRSTEGLILIVTLWPAGPGGASTTHKVMCPDDAACSDLSKLDPKVFDPVPPESACTQINGGPEQARINGTLGDRGVDATFTRTNSCEIARYDKVAFLFKS